MEYLAQEIRSEQLFGAVQALRGAEYLGANVTLPHKPAVMALVDHVSPLARRIGAVNTVFKAGGRLIGDNTDAPAVVRCLRESLAFAPEDERVLLLGAGGAARGVAVGLLDAGVRRLAIWNRTAQRSRALVQSLARLAPSTVTDIDMVADLGSALSAATLLVNATSVGLDGSSVPVSPVTLPKTARVFDLVYGPSTTPLVRAARAHGLPAEDGLRMLVYQAAASFALWTGLRPPEDIMLKAAVRALGLRQELASSTAGGDET
jgi:shikimate dehydrogenase